MWLSLRLSGGPAVAWTSIPRAVAATTATATAAGKLRLQLGNLLIGGMQLLVSLRQVVGKLADAVFGAAQLLLRLPMEPRHEGEN